MIRFALLAILLMLFFGPVKLSAQDEINWLSFPELEAAMAIETRPVLIDFYTTWCGWCKRMDKTTFLNDQVVTFVNDNFYAVKFDAEQKETIRFRGQDFKYVAKGRRGYNELAAGFLQGQLSYPSYVFLNEEMAIITIVRGYREKSSFMPVLAYLGEGHYLSQEWEEFMTTWEGK